MGMAASQARYLSLVARKTNTEYEGQQINQERTVLANRTADLFNQMLRTEVPTCPDSNDFTKVQYSWSDGFNEAVLSDYYQLSTGDEDYNYVVTNYHYEDVYTGTRKVMNDPKVQAERVAEYKYDSSEDEEYIVKTIKYDPDKQEYVTVSDNNVKKVFTLAEQYGAILPELDAIHNRTYKLYAPSFEYDETTDSYRYPTDEKDEQGETIYHVFNRVDMQDDIELMKLKRTYGDQLDEDAQYYAYLDEETGLLHYLNEKDVEGLKHNQGIGAEIVIRKQYDGTVYYTDGEKYVTQKELADIDLQQQLNKLYLKQADLSDYFFNFQYIGNSKLKELTIKDMEDPDIAAEIRQIRDDMASEEKGHKVANANLNACFDLTTGEYVGGIFAFQYNGQRYYTTLKDLDTSARSAYEELAWELADNAIDFQLDRLPYYKAVYLNTKVEDTQKALLETDGKGRFTSMRLEDDSAVYTLNTETITDEEAYANAMNQYYYKQEKYDKAIRDINAKTELIQAQDRTLELRLRQLDTEQNALQVEMEAVKKVISKNVESSFKTFGGG